MRSKLFVVASVAIAALGVGAASTAGAAGVRAHGAAAAPTVSLRSTSLGKILVNSKGITLYLWEKDKNGKSACSGDCASIWPLLIISGKPTAGPGVKASELGEYAVGKGKYEVTYYRHPLYTYVSDVKPGLTTGQGSTSFGAAWWVVSASGAAITKS